jgi:hypothetical protein
VTACGGMAGMMGRGPMGASIMGHGAGMRLIFALMDSASTLSGSGHTCFGSGCPPERPEPRVAQNAPAPRFHHRRGSGSGHQIPCRSFAARSNASACFAISCD